MGYRRLKRLQRLRALHNIGRVIGYLIGMSIYISLMLLTLLGLVGLVEWIG